MPKGIVGKVFNFTALFLDANGDVATLTGTPTIEVFYFTDDGTKTNVVATSTAMTATSESGRWVHPYTIGSVVAVRYTLYGVMRGVDAGSGETYVHTQEVDIYEISDSQTATTGMGSTFVRGG